MSTGWLEYRLADVCEILSELVDPTDAAYCDLPHVGGANMQSGLDALIDVRTAAEEKLISGKFIFDDGVVLYSKIRPYLRKVARPGFSGLCSADVYPLTPKNNLISRDYLYYVLTSEAFTAYAEMGSARSGMPKVNREHLFGFSIRLPPLAEQQRIVTVLDEAFAGITAAVDSARACSSYAANFAWEYLANVFESASENWVREPISERVRFVDYRGKTPPKRPFGVRLITAKNVKMGFVQRQPEEFIDAGAYAGWMTRGYPSRGDVLFTTEAPLANVAQLSTDEPVVIGQRLITMQPNREKLDPAFLKYMLLSRPLQSAIRSKGTGATVQGIKASLLKKIEIAYPPSTAEQARIVSELDAVFESSRELTALHEHKLALLAELKQSLLARALSGELIREPVAA